MNRIVETMNGLKANKQTAMIGFITLGVNDDEYYIQTMQDEGMNLIELGLPFSDPIAEGSVIQEANVEALSNGMTTKKAMAKVKKLRETITVPLVYLLYYNQVFKYGSEKFIQECKESGIDGLIIPDLPYEHRHELQDICDQYDIILISMVTPVSSNRKQMITKNAKGFLYCVTSLGVTGVRSSFAYDLKSFIEELNTYSDVPKALGFGISEPSQVKEFKQYADGIIIGSAIVKKARSKDKEGFRQYIKEIVEACK